MFLHAWWLILAKNFLDIPFTAATKISDITVVLWFLKASYVEILTIKIYDQDHKKKKKKFHLHIKKLSNNWKKKSEACFQVL